LKNRKGGTIHTSTLAGEKKKKKKEKCSSCGRKKIGQTTAIRKPKTIKGKRTPDYETLRKKKARKTEKTIITKEKKKEKGTDITQLQRERNKDTKTGEAKKKELS